MERIRNFVARKQSYERIGEDRDGGPDVSETRPLRSGEDEDAEDEASVQKEEEPFQWIIYGMFFLLGVAMLWAW